MKKILFTCLLFLTFTVVKAQVASHNNYNSCKPYNSLIKDSSEMSDFDYYMAKRRSKNTAAWVLLGGGALATVVGVAIFPKDYDIIFGNDKSTESQATTSNVVMIAGIAAMLGSIPFYISSTLNKQRAHLSIKNQKTGYGLPARGSKKITGLTLSIPLG
ncbi:MAG: hypothetical protein ABIO04_13625 [Ferruginibacter sp.]